MDQIGKMSKNLNPFFLIILFFLLLCSISMAEGVKLKTFRQEYSSFNQSHYTIFDIDRPATISNDALQVTPDSISPEFNLFNNSGRVILRRKFKLWEQNNINSSDQNQEIISSFNTSFLINILGLRNETPGEGMAFVIVPDLNLPVNSSGQFLGLTNSSTDGSPANELVAMEIDTSKQDFDPDDNHVGINVNSIRSIKTESLTPHNITIATILDAKFYNFWIDYDGADKKIEVYVTEQSDQNGPTPPKPRSSILSAELNLRDYVNQYSYFGFSASTGRDTRELNCVFRWNLTVHYFPERDQEWLTIVLGAGIPILVIIFFSLIGFGYCFRRRKMESISRSKLVGALQNLPGMPREFEFRSLKKATNNFDKKNELGKGGYGVVYKGFLVKENLEIAVKWFLRENIKGEDDFLKELTIINRLRHKHLVKLLGWCHKNKKLLLVYEYMPNGSLDMHLFPAPNKDPLRWNLRYKIISEVAFALHYLHNEYDQKVIHRDLKASNIMLDSNFNARLGDFGLARALENENTSYQEVRGVLGTLGYIAPECYHTGKATQQSDVYAFGAVLLEVVCGQRPGAKIDNFELLVDWVWYLHRDGRLIEAMDRNLENDYVVEEAKRLLLLGLACSHPVASERPKTHAIVQIVSGMVPVPFVPPFKPAFVWPAFGAVDANSSFSDTTSISSTHSGLGVIS
ncbi:hypothetical protein RD792_013077 [Penstemon davidsonii]|uniref:Protein kinase domain-containing protein n=1 Tax=Penstemon davidsonii TaxID=160366 RepID=A0ABR0CT05_9LAMI|nr:hypothetical protein RD792_013077 [Penstemon davidsonii]